ncbi:hypothetical protein PIB30_062841 [Stylosanthes scabra]|uniref:DUF4283 domain-containing protein n=1 Tax=Stylosanthes scabra TaxID=79078 RepID=A0ABU6VN04_9FABA|nr:hypothetical protein [Stylosanthes scabra]
MEFLEAHLIEGKVITMEQENHDGFIEENMNLVAKVISDKELTFRTIKAALKGIWGHSKGVRGGSHAVLLDFVNKKTAEKVGMDLGSIMEVDDPWRNIILMRSFLRVKVLLDIRKPLPTTGCWLRDPSIPRYKPCLRVARAKSLDPHDFEDMQLNEGRRNKKEERADSPKQVQKWSIGRRLGREKAATTWRENEE